MASLDPITDQLLRDYLLRATPEVETERLDALSISDDDLAWRLRACESDLLDQYVRGELSGRTLELFVSSYLSSARGAEKLAFAESLRSIGDRHGAPAPLRPAPLALPSGRWWFSSHAPRWAMAGLALVLLLGATILLRRERHQIPAATPGITVSPGGNQPRTIAQPPAPAAAHDTRAAAAAPAATAIFVLSPPMRGVGAIPIVTISRPAQGLRLRLRLEADDFPGYRASLEGAVAGQGLWRSGALTAKTEGGHRVVDVEVPSSLLRSQNYSLVLAGVPARGRQELITSYSFAVRRR